MYVGIGTVSVFLGRGATVKAPAHPHVMATQYFVSDTLPHVMATQYFVSDTFLASYFQTQNMSGQQNFTSTELRKSCSYINNDL